MNETTNIPAILRGKPQGTKLHDLARGINVYLDNIADDCNEVHCFEKKGLQMHYYSSKGTLVGFEDGMVILVPSETMQDLSKFAWNKGDVLVNKDRDVHVIFERFADDTYCSFVGKYYLWKENNDTEQFCKNERLLTSDFQKAGKDAAQTYISTIEEKLGGQLNRETLEIEKAQPEFKDGDMISLEIRYINSEDVIVETYIVHSDYNYGEELNFYAGCNNIGMIKYNSCVKPTNNSVRKVFIRYATDSEKQQFFDTLAKEGKAWDAEKKQVVRLQVSDKLYYFEMENELAYIAKLKEAKGGKYTFESNVSWCPRNSTNGYDYEEGSFTVSDKDCYGFREANADECKIFEKFLVEHAMKSFKFKALDYVLAKNITCYESNAWNLFQYAYRNKDGAHIMVGGAAFLQCIPYVGNEYLLGTTKSYSTKK